MTLVESESLYTRAKLPVMHFLLQCYHVGLASQPGNSSFHIISEPCHTRRQVGNAAYSLQIDHRSYPNSIKNHGKPLNVMPQYLCYLLTFFYRVVAVRWWWG